MNSLPDSPLFRFACERVCGFMEETGMAAGLSGGVLVALSGGADSVFLLYFLHAMREKKPFPLAALHVHHHLRGEEADRDAAFCASLCRELSVSFSLSHADVRAEAERCGRGIEETARIVRYQALRRELSAHPELSRIATAHNATDRAETMLLHLLRGGGLRALCGIPALTGELMRPLLPLTGREIRAALREAGIRFVEDSTNDDTAYARNYLRHEILPRLEPLAPEPEKMFGRTAEILSTDAAYLDFQTDEALRRGKTDEGFLTEKLAELPAPIRRRVIVRLHEDARDACAFSLSLGHTHILEIEKKLTEKKSFRLSVPAGLSAVSENGFFSFLPSGQAQPEKEEILLQEGENAFPGGYILTVRREENRTFLACFSNLHKIDTKTAISSATIRGNLRARVRRGGDKYRYRGHDHTVKNVMNEVGIPAGIRAGYPVVADEAGVLWIPGGPVRENRTRHE